MYELNLMRKLKMVGNNTIQVENFCSDVFTQ